MMPHYTASPCMRRAMHGFTLLELMLVLLLLGLAYGLAGPMLGEQPAGIELQNASRQIAAGLRKARSMAVTQQHDTTLTIDLDARTFAVTGDPKRYALPEALDYSIYTSHSEVIQERIGHIRFYSDGSSTGGRISARAPKGMQQNIDVDWLTGRANIR